MFSEPTSWMKTMRICSSICVSQWKEDIRGTKTRRQREKEKSGRANYYVLCCWNVSQFSGRGCFFQNIFIPDFLCTSAYRHRNTVSYFLMAKYCPAFSQCCADAGGCWERGPPAIGSSMFSPSVLVVLLVSGRSQHQPAQCHPVFNHM